MPSTPLRPGILRVAFALATPCLACFDANVVAGLPCISDDDCGPGICVEQVCEVDGQTGGGGASSTMGTSSTGLGTSEAATSAETWSGNQSGGAAAGTFVSQGMVSGSGDLTATSSGEGSDLTAVDEGIVPPECETPDFPDEQLRLAVSEHIAPETGAIINIEEITELRLSDEGIQSLEGIECFTHLGVLEADDNKISTLAPLGKLERILQLNLNFNQIADVEPLVAVAETLLVLHLSNNALVNGDEIGQLKQLNYLDVADNDLSDIGWVSTLAQLRVLSLNGLPLSAPEQIEGLHDLQGLEILTLVDTQLSDLSGTIENLNSLVALSVSGSPIRALDPFMELNFDILAYLSITDTEIDCDDYAEEIARLRETINANADGDETLGFYSDCEVEDNPSRNRPQPSLQELHAAVTRLKLRSRHH